MELVGYLPESSLLQQSSFRRFNKDDGLKRLVLRVPHTVAAKFGGRVVEGTADVAYIIQTVDETAPVGSDLSVTEGVPYIAVQSPDLVRAITESLRPRMSYALAEVVDGMFDMRALAYNLGSCFAAGVSGAKVPFTKESAGVRLLSPSWTVPVMGEVTVGPGVARTSREYVTLAGIAGPSGITVLQLIADALPSTRVKPYQGLKLSGYVLRVFGVVLAASQGCGSAPHHLQAFFRGMSSPWSLWAHCDEGGWSRSMLRAATYPPSSGVLAATGDEIIGIPLKSDVDAKSLTRIAVGMYLSFAATMVVADCQDSGRPSSFRRDGGDEARPSSFGELAPRTYDVLEEWRRIMSKRLGLHMSAVLDGHSCRAYFATDRVDSHLENDELLPFWWVEPSFIFLGDAGKLDMPVRPGKVVEMPLARSDDVIVPDIQTDFRGCLPGGGKAMVIRSPGGLRMEGMSYILSGDYRSADGLTHTNYVVAGPYGAVTTDALFVAEGVTNAADRRWITPHDPVPNPSEGYMRTVSAFVYEYRGRGTEPATLDWLECKVHSSMGFFRVGEDDFSTKKRTHKSVPPGYQNLVRPYDLVSPQISLKNKSIAPGSAPAGPEPPLPTEPPVTDAEPAPPLKLLGGPPDTVVDDSPPVELGLDPKIGLRQEMTPARHEKPAEEQGGSEEPSA